MIQNVPDWIDLQQVAVRLYFEAWARVVEAIVPLLAGSPFSVVLRDRKLVPVEEDRPWEKITLEESQHSFEQCLDRAQPDLRLCCALIQQSQEIGLKARICRVSPYLLLLGSDPKTWAKQNADFSEFRTIDASDLIKVVNAVSAQQVGPEFATTFETVRKLRNKFSHLGSVKQRIDPISLLDILVDQWAELYADKCWHSELRDIESSNQYALFHDKNFNEFTSVLHRVGELNQLLTDKQRRRLLGFAPNARLFQCPHCMDEARFDDQVDDYSTASLVASVRHS